MRDGTERDVGGSHTERPSILLVRSLLQEEPPGTLEHVTVNGRDPLELGSKGVESSCAIGRTLCDIFQNACQ